MRRNEAVGPGELDHGALGTPGIVFLVLAAVTPIGAVASAMALGFVLGNGAGLPGTYVVAGIILLLFAVGYAAMSHHMTNAGGFYAYITRGLGRPAGAAAAMVALVSYNALVCAILASLGYFAHLTFDGELSIDIPWQVWTAVALLLVAILGRRQVDVNAKLLGAALIVEVLTIAVIDVAILADKGLGAFTLHSFTPNAVFAGGAGGALVFAFNSFIGFEATALFSEEARDPTRTVPRATYVAVILIAIFYALTAWTFVAAFGDDHIVATVADPQLGGPGTFLFRVDAQFVGGFTTHAIQWLVVSSLLAALIATHNATARYFFALGRDGLLPAAVARTHPVHKSPYVGSAVQAGVTTIVMGSYMIGGSDPLLTIAASLGALGTIGVVGLQAACAFAAVRFFRVRGDRRIWRTLISPLVGGLGLTTGAILIIHHYPSLTGATGLANQLPWLLVAAALAGCAYALRLRSERPEVYAVLGGDELLPAAAAAGS